MSTIISYILKVLLIVAVLWIAYATARPAMLWALLALYSLDFKRDLRASVPPREKNKPGVAAGE